MFKAITVKQKTLKTLKVKAASFKVCDDLGYTVFTSSF